MAIQTQRLTVEEFEQFAARPENADRLFEYIGGDVIEAVSNQRSSAIAYRLGLFLGMYLLQHNTGGVTTGADGGYEIPGERYIPDVAYVSAARQSEPSENAYGPIPPDLAVEVLSPSNTAHEMRIKIVNYLSVNTTVWVVDPDRRVVEVYVPGQPVRTLAADATLDGGDLLPGFALAVGDIFQTGHDQRGV